MTECTGCAALEARVEHLEEVIDGLSALIKVDANDVCAVVDENTRLRARDAEIRKRAETLVEELRGGLQITGSFCNYCKQAFTSILGDTPDACAAFAREHDKVCASNPVVVERDSLRAQLAALKRLLPECLGEWTDGSGGHRMYAGGCAEVGKWDVGMGFVCDAHLNRNGGDDDAWEWDKERDSLRAQLSATQAALTKACSLLDDAVQLRDDAREWFPRIAELRKLGVNL